MLKLKSQQSVYDAVNGVVQDILHLEYREVAEKYVNALIILEDRWVANNYVLTAELINTLADSRIVDKTKHTSVDDTHLFKTVQPKVSPYLIAWVNANAQNHRWYMGLLFVMLFYFYETHPRDELVTLKWVMSVIGSGRFIDSFFAFKLDKALQLVDETLAIETTQPSEPHMVYDYITEDEFYTFNKNGD